MPGNREFPVLLEPEALIEIGEEISITLKQPQYEEADTEMKHYNEGGSTAAVVLSDERVRPLMGRVGDYTGDLPGFPEPPQFWIDAQHDSLSQHQAYKYLPDIVDKRFAQVGGSGVHCVKAFLAGASEAVLLTPMLGGVLFAQSLAKKIGVANHLLRVIGVGDELQFRNGSIDLVCSGGCLHHIDAHIALREFKRVLMDARRFACVDPWANPSLFFSRLLEIWYKFLAFGDVKNQKAR